MRTKAKRPPSRTVRRSFALAADLVARAQAVADPKEAPNLNRLVAKALEEFIRRREREEFERRMDEMGRDPSIRAVCREINEEFRVAEPDGLPDD